MLVIVACCLTLLPPVRGKDGESWVDKKVMTKKAGIKIAQTGEKDPVRYIATLTDMLYRVEEERGEFIKVRHRGVAGWLPKNDAVLLDDAVTYFTARIRVNGKDAYAYAHRGRAWYARREYDKAIRDYGEPIRLDAKNAKAFKGRGNAGYVKREYDKAIKDYDEAIRLDPKDAEAFVYRGITWEAKQDCDKAIKDYDEAIRLDPKDAEAFVNRAWLWATCPEEKYRSRSRVRCPIPSLSHEQGGSPVDLLNPFPTVDIVGARAVVSNGIMSSVADALQ
jgi:tetratricopeptide (TPR) repeat protein